MESMLHLRPLGADRSVVGRLVPRQLVVLLAVLLDLLRG